MLLLLMLAHLFNIPYRVSQKTIRVYVYLPHAYRIA